MGVYTHAKINNREVALKQFSTFRVTGLCNGRRFKPMEYSSFDAANCIHLHNGSVWGIKPDGKRVLLKEITN